MANKRINDLTQRGSVDTTINLAADDASQTWRVSMAQILAFVKAQTEVPGAIMMDASSTPPTGWLACNGTAVSRTTYAALFARIGTTFGTGDGTTTFNVPDFRNVFPRGANSSTRAVGGITHPAAALGSTTLDQMQGHLHGPNASSFLVGGGAGSANLGGGALFNVSAATSGPITDGTNGTPRTGSTTFPVNVAVNFIIKT